MRYITWALASLMSYNLAHHTRGLSGHPGGFSPREIATLALALPGVDRSRVPAAETLDAESIQRCFLGPMAETVGAYRPLSRVGYELLFDGRPVHTGDASLYSRLAAEENCAFNEARYPETAVECRFNGVALR